MEPSTVDLGFELHAPLLSVAGLALVPHGEDHHLGTVEPVQHDVAAVAEVDEPFAELGVEIFHWATDAWLPREHADAITNGLDRALGGVGVTDYQVPMKALHVAQRPR